MHMCICMHAGVSVRRTDGIDCIVLGSSRAN